MTHCLGHFGKYLHNVTRLSSWPCLVKQITLTVDNNNAAVSQFVLVYRLCLHERLRIERTQGHGLVEADNAIIYLNLFQ